jgi:hypothetical protein
MSRAVVLDVVDDEKLVLRLTATCALTAVCIERVTPDLDIVAFLGSQPVIVLEVAPLIVPLSKPATHFGPASTLAFGHGI